MVYIKQKKFTCGSWEPFKKTKFQLKQIHFSSITKFQLKVCKLKYIIQKKELHFSSKTPNFSPNRAGGKHKFQKTGKKIRRFQLPLLRAGQRTGTERKFQILASRTLSSGEKLDGNGSSKVAGKTETGGNGK
ncbi:Uncharacterized protein Fot_53151 [Forsythia ovata]|uniref:Uncharacterized protein n=1 Tax=Forsythia ovata TaxID=205694 RepID=A0ABD1PHY1_9LAMI